LKPSKSVNKDIIWQSEVGNVYIAGEPCLADNRVYLGIVDDCRAVEGGVVAVDAGSGKTVWQTYIGASVASPVTVCGQFVLANTIDGLVACMDGDSGKILWVHQMPDKHDRWINGRVVVSENCAYAGTTSRLICLDMKTGKKIWTFGDSKKTTDAMGRLANPVYYKGNIFITGTSTPAYLLDAKDGKIVHCEQGPMRMRLGGRLAVYGEVALIGDSPGNIHCFSLKNGRHLWHKQISYSWLASCATEFHGSFLFGTAEGLGRYSYKKARKLAFFKPGADLMAVVPNRRHKTSCMGVAAVQGNDIWIGASDGFLYHLQGRNLKELKRFRFGQPLVGHLVHDNIDSLYITTFDGRLVRMRV